MSIEEFEATEGVSRVNVNRRITQANAYFPVSVDNGGTGATSLTSGNILIGNGTNAITSVSTLSVEKGGTGVNALTSGNILLGNGTDAITSISTLPITSGGTGATTTADALNNLGIPVEYGTWTPTLTNRGYDPNPTYTVGAIQGTYTKIGNLVFITMYIKATITNTGGSTGYSGIGGLPFVASTRVAMTVYEFDSNMLETTDIVKCGITEGGNVINVTDKYGMYAMKWKTCSNANISMSGFYRIS